MTLSFFRKRKEQKQESGVVKLYKAVTVDESFNFKTAKVIDFCVKELLSLSQGNITDVEADFTNGVNKTWKEYASFVNYAQKHNDSHIEMYSSYIIDGMSGQLHFCNDTNRLNRNENEMNMIDIIISFPNKTVDISFLRKFLTDLFQIETFDYGYVCFLTDEHDILSERKIKKGLFSETSTWTKKDIEKREKIRDSKDGFLPDVYQINILNEEQFKKIDKNIGILHEIANSTLKIWELQKEEIDKVKLCNYGN